MAEALQGTLYTTGYSGGGSPDRLILDWSATQDIAQNKSTVTWSVRVGGGQSGYYNTLSKRYVKVGSYQRTAGSDYFDGSQLRVYNGTPISDLNGTVEILHSQDGSGSFSVDLRGMFEYTFVGNGNRYNSYKSETFTLKKIPRKATITSAPNFTDLDSPAVSYQNPAGSSATLRIAISFDGVTDDIAYRETDPLGVAYVFGAFSSQELALLRTQATTPSIPIYFLLETTIGDDVFVDVVEKTFSVADTQTSKPHVTVTLSPDNSIVPSSISSDLSDVYVQQVSKVDVSLQAIGVYGAAIESVTTLVEGQTYTGTTFTTGTIQTSGVIPVTVTAVDSRGHVRTVTQNITALPYSYPYPSQTSVVRCDDNGNPKNDGEKLKLTSTRNFSSIGGVNKAKIEHRWKLSSATWGSQAWTTDLAETASGNYISTVISGTFDKALAYTVQVRCIDKLGNSTVLEFDIPTQTITFHLREGGDGVGIGKYCEHSDAFEVAYDSDFEKDITVHGDLTVEGDLDTATLGKIANAVKATLLDAVYPVGALYMSTGSADPSTLFGGTWARIEDTFLLAAGSSHQAGSSGGSESVTLDLNNYKNGVWRYTQISGSDTYSDNMTVGGTWGVRGGGTNTPFSIMPPYAAVYVWKRTA